MIFLVDFPDNIFSISFIMFFRFCLLGGVIAMRKIHLHVIQQTGMFCADEMLYPETLQYLLDLLVYIAIGARSVEDQGHRFGDPFLLGVLFFRIAMITVN